MSDIPAASPASTASPATALPGNNIVVETAVNSVPDKIQLLSRQIEVTGTLAQPPAGNSITLNTLIGPLVLVLPTLAQVQQDKLLQQLNTLFHTQKPITIVMQPGNPPSQAFLLLPPTTTPSPYQSQAASYFQSQPLVQTTAALSPNTTLSALVLPNGITFPFSAAVQAEQIPYTDLNPNMRAGAGNPEATSNPAAVFSAEGAASETQALPNLQSLSAPVSADLTAPHTGIAALLQPGTELTLRIDAVITPAAQGRNPPLPQGNQILAVVTGTGPGGQIILKAGDATLFVRQPVDAPVGAQLLLTVEPARPDVAAYVTASDLPQFSALQQIIAALQQSDPAAARSILATSLPQPGETLPGALLFFLSAVRQGDVRNWLGDTALDMLTRAGKADLIGRLAQELQQAVHSSRDNAVGEWRTYQVPLQDNNHLGVLYFHVHRDGHHASGQSGENGKATAAQMRFLIDVRMSRLGPLQLDGFLRQRQLDIIVRSENPLPVWLNQDLRQTYVKTMESIGYTGSLNFQNGRQGWLKVQQPGAGKAITT